MEKAGQLSKINTVRALKVLKYFNYLKIDENIL